MSKDPIPAEHHSFAALLTICCLVTFGCYFAVSMRLPVVPLYARGFGVSTSQIGMINAAFFLMAGPTAGIPQLYSAVWVWDPRPAALWVSGWGFDRCF